MRVCQDKHVKIQVLEEKLVQKPITTDIKQEFSLYEEGEIQIKMEAEEEIQVLQEKLVQKPIK